MRKIKSHSYEKENLQTAVSVLLIILFIVTVMLFCVITFNYNPNTAVIQNPMIVVYDS